MLSINSGVYWVEGFNWCEFGTLGGSGWQAPAYPSHKLVCKGGPAHKPQSVVL